jgi:hypothetical protein
MTDLQQLRALAKAATRGTWATGKTHGRTRVWCDGWYKIADFDLSPNLTGAQKEANATFSAAVGPDTVLELLDKIESQRDALAGAAVVAYVASNGIRTLRVRLAMLETDARRYGALLSIGLPLCFMGRHFEDKASADAAIDAERARHSEVKA